jgi:hypothetical protein
LYICNISNSSNTHQSQSYCTLTCQRITTVNVHKQQNSMWDSCCSCTLGVKSVSDNISEREVSIWTFIRTKLSGWNRMTQTLSYNLLIIISEQTNTLTLWVNSGLFCTPYWPWCLFITGSYLLLKTNLMHSIIFYDMSCRPLTDCLI